MEKNGLKVVCLYPELYPRCFIMLNKYHIYNVTEEHYGGIGNNGQYYINNFWFSKLCFVPLYQLRKDKIEHLKTIIYGMDKGQHIKKQETLSYRI